MGNNFVIKFFSLSLISCFVARFAWDHRFQTEMSFSFEAIQFQPIFQGER